MDEEIKSMTTASAAPELYSTLVDLGVHDSILSLLTHENTDIAIAAVGLIDELTDEEVLGDTSEEGEEGMKALVKALVRIIVTNIDTWDVEHTMFRLRVAFWKCLYKT